VTVVVKARLEFSEKKETEEEEDEEDENNDKDEDEEDEDADADALLREATDAYHQRVLEEAMASQQNQQPNKYTCMICEDAIEPFDHRKCQGLIPYTCNECFDYYDDHRPCEGMTKSEINYEDYCDNNMRNGRHW